MTGAVALPTISADVPMTGAVALPTIGELLPKLSDGPRIPRATYRLQFNADFTFRQAEALLPYLTALGISDCYCSPILRARAGSTHGYDIIDHSQLNPVLGTPADWQSFAGAARAAGIGLIVDIVPNHMGIGTAENGWWTDVLENGPSSPYSRFFDIDWQPVKPELANTLLLPILGDQYGNVLERGELTLCYEQDAFFLCYYDHRLPLAPRTYAVVLEAGLPALVAELGPEDPCVQEYQSILTALNYLPLRTETDPARLAERGREKEVIKRRIAQLRGSCPAVEQLLTATIDEFNGQVGTPASFDQLDALIAAQPYRLSYWRVAAEEINYRRFFDINDLAAIRVELPEVFAATHQLILDELAAGNITGLRIDHPDGLWNPPQYFHRLQSAYVRALLVARHGATFAADELEVLVESWLAERVAEGAAARWPLYVVAEKILSEREPLPRTWAVHGTTGYDFLNAVNGIFVERANVKAFDRIYRRFLQADEPLGRDHFRNLVNGSKKRIMLISLASEINGLSHQLERISEHNRRYRDFTLQGLTFALRELIAGLAVYRTYVHVEIEGVAKQDQKYVEAATAEAKQRNPRTDPSVFDFIRDTLLLRNLEVFQPADQAQVINFVMRFQQISGPVMAKGVEDTTFYIYNRLVALNEVGGHPEDFGTTLLAFHRDNNARQHYWPHAMLTTTTHDTKRSEDLRVRIDVLSELPEEWEAAVGRWSALNASFTVDRDGEAQPSRNDEYLLYQTLIGAWPTVGTLLDGEAMAAFRTRIVAYMQKATKEAKVHTSWINPNAEYDAAIVAFVAAVLPDDGATPFLTDFRAFQGRVARYGQWNALAQTLLKLTVPGVPDIYQGTELWDLSLVDPDNRRPVDYAGRQALLDDLRADTDLTAGTLRRDGRRRLVTGLVEGSADGRIKLYLTAQTLAFRREHAELFAHGDYTPLEVAGEQGDHVCAFARIHDTAEIVVAVPRLVARLIEDVTRPPIGPAVWRGSRLVLPAATAGTRYRQVLTGEVLTVTDGADGPGLPLAAVFAHCPVALLVRL